MLESWRDVAFWSNGSFWDVLHVSCMVWGIRGLLFSLPAGSMCAYSLCFPAVAAQVWAGQSSGTHVTLLALCPPWLSLFVPQTGSCCAWEIPSPLPPCPSAASPGISQHWVRAQLPHGDGTGSRRDRASSRFGWGVPHCQSLAKGAHTHAVWRRTRASKWDLFSFISQSSIP